MDVFVKVASFLVVLGILVVFHEAGHYLVARLCGVKVLRFSVGFGRVLWSRRYGRDRTEFAVSAIPLGGYVKMADEREGDLAPEDVARSFNRASFGRRIAIVAAGPIANLLLAVLLYAATFMAGIPGQKPVLAEPPSGTPAAIAGLRGGDLVTAIDGEPVQSLQDLRWRLVTASGRDDIDVEVESRDGRRSRHLLPLAALGPADWEGPFLHKLGLSPDLGAPLVDEAVAGKPAQRAGLQAGDRIVAVDGAVARSPSDVAGATNAKPASGSSSAPTRSAARLSGKRSSTSAGRTMCAPASAAAAHATWLRRPANPAMSSARRSTCGRATSASRRSEASSPRGG